jgi:hypothetical protein
MDEIREEKHRVRATVDTKESVPMNRAAATVEDVLCGVYLPFKKTDRPLLRFLPTDEQEQRLDAPMFSMRSKLTQPNGELTIISANEVLVKSHTSATWNSGLTENILVGEPWDLRIEHVRPLFTYHSEPKTTGSFWLTWTNLLSNVSRRSRSYTGEVKTNKFDPLRLTLATGLEICFDVHAGYRRSSQDETVMFDEMAAEFSLPRDTQGTNEIYESMEQLEDVLRLVSFVGEYRCACVGWHAVDSSSVTEFYRPRRSPVEEAPSVHAALVEYRYFAEFLITGYKAFASIAPNVAVRRALDYVVPDKNETLETEYIMLYAAVETLILFFRQQQRLEFIFADENEWLALCRNLRKWLKEQPELTADKEKRAMVYDKLPELTRPSFSSAFAKFCDYYNVDVSDLWPMAGQKEGDSLSVIRNKLVHGDVYGPRKYRALLGACQHLRWSVYRMLFGVLGWPIAQTRIDPERAAHSAIHKTWRQDREIVSE